MCDFGVEPPRKTVFERWEGMRWGRDVEDAILLVDDEGVLRSDKVVKRLLRQREKAADAITARIAVMARSAAA